jgi:putative SOS response-associated peptidase YedK
VIEGGKQPYAIARADGEPLALADLGELAGRGDRAHFAIITTRPNAEMVPLQPHAVVVDPKDWPAWLGEWRRPHHAPRAPPAGTLRAWPVSRNVNSPRNNSAELLEPIQA